METGCNMRVPRKKEEGYNQRHLKRFCQDSRVNTTDDFTHLCRMVDDACNLLSMALEHSNNLLCILVKYNCILIISTYNKFRPYDQYDIKYFKLTRDCAKKNQNKIPNLRG